MVLQNVATMSIKRRVSMPACRQGLTLTPVGSVDRNWGSCGEMNKIGLQGKMGYHPVCKTPTANQEQVLDSEGSGERVGESG